jgi:ABC-2 type transport system permease protein
VAITLAGAVMGLIAKSAGEALAGSSSFAAALAKLGARGFGARAYLGVAFLVIALLVALVAASLAVAARGEEASGRLDHLLVRPVSRLSWLIGRLAAAAGAVLLAGILAAVGAWLGAASQDAGIGMARLLQAGANVVAPALVVLGVGALALGLWPRAVSATTYGLVAWSFLVQIVGEIVNGNHWLLDTAIFRHMTAAPAVDPNWTADAIMVGLGLVAAGIGAAVFIHRDLSSE